MKNFLLDSGRTTAQGNFQGRHQSISRYLQFRPWKLGIEIETIRGGQECFSSDLVLARAGLIPIKTDEINISLDSESRKKTESVSGKCRFQKKSRTWKMEEACPELPKDVSWLVAWIDVGLEGGTVTIVLQAGEDCEINLNRYHEEKLVSLIYADFVPESIVENVLRAGNEFCQGAEHLDDAKTDLALGKESDDRRTDGKCCGLPERKYVDPGQYIDRKDADCEG